LAAAPGEKLDPKLSNQFGVSEPYREAIQQSFSGLVVYYRKKGTLSPRCSSISSSNVRVIAEFEGMCGRIAAAALTEDEPGCVGRVGYAVGRPGTFEQT